ncbi:MAG: low specificity L-threonine aldolase [Lachnospira sp.]|nr:low specificity L-threonine aldolase [Lachnospira sp.]
MISFESDYIAGAHPKVLEALLQTNMVALSGYGSDPFTERAKENIRKVCECPEAEVHFLVGGTQTNAVVISSLLKSYEGVVAAETGHVSTHEAGAIEHTGHKVLALSQCDGKIDSSELASYLAGFFADANHEHMVFPGMVYISHPTEYGTLYSKSELEAIADVCRRYEMPLYLDGARLGYGIMSRETDVTMADIARLCDVFYIGGTKVGALCGEAVVFTKSNAPKHFTTIIKQNGALLAKGRLLGVQFDALFTDNLYFDISKHAIHMAEQLKAVLKEKGYTFYLESPTNQQFVVLEDEKYEKLKEQVAMSFWEKPDETHTVVRLATSWSTREEDVEVLRGIL